MVKKRPKTAKSKKKEKNEKTCWGKRSFFGRGPQPSSLQFCSSLQEMVIHIHKPQFYFFRGLGLLVWALWSFKVWKNGHFLKN